MAVFKFKTPISEADVRKLKVNDVLYVSGTVATARDEAHKKALELYREGKKLPLDLEGLAVFHCGPIMKKEGDKWVVVAAGPTTSTRMDQFEDEWVRGQLKLCRNMALFTAPSLAVQECWLQRLLRA